MRAVLIASCFVLFAACGVSEGDLALADASDCPDASPRGMGGVPAARVVLNAYYLQEEGARALRLGQTESPALEEVLAKSSAMGVFALRTNGFNDAAEKVGDTAIQIAPLEYDEIAFRGLDLVLARAQVHGVKLVLPLGNYWDAYGGARQYVKWRGLPDPVEGDRRFFTDPAVVDHFVRHITHLLNRVNTVDGIRYGDHPAVWAWELLNEPRGQGLDKDGIQLREWVDRVGKVIREQAPGHLIGTGEEGFEPAEDGYDRAYFRQVAPTLLTSSGNSFRRNTASPYIDFGSVHLYPEAWKVPLEHAARMGANWIWQHARVAAELGKPLLVGEFALKNEEGLPLEVRKEIYRGWFSCAKRSGAAGSAPWLFSNDARPDAWDDYTFYFRDGSSPEDPANRYADVVIEAAAP